MAKLGATLAQRLGVGVIAMMAITLPVLYYSINRVVEVSNRESFITHVRASARLLVDQFESTGLPADDAGMLTVLDSVALSGDIALAEFVIEGRTLRSRLSTAAAVAGQEDFEFGSGAGNVYIVSSSISLGDRQVVLRLGFDELPALQRIAEARRSLLIALGAYLAATIAAALWLSRYLSKPIDQLQLASRRIASGDRTAQLSVNSGSREMRALANDLDQMRNELVGAAARLQQEMEERAVLEAQLRQKQRLETVGTLAGGIAHEINNVLVPITLRTEMAIDQLPEGHKARGDLDVVLSAARRARDTVSKILGFGRHMPEVAPARIDIVPAVNEALHLIDTLKPAGIEVRTEIDDSCPQIEADAGSIVHIALNLCSNALHAMHNDAGTLTLRLQPRTVGSRRFLALEVADTGHGMDQAIQERIFEPFFTTREIGQGTGLGLSVVHGIATRLNATIEVRSAPGKGTTICVLFPAL